MRAVVYIALLRAVNVGGTGILPMSVLMTICEKLGFSDVKTYIASGNVIFKSSESEVKVRAALEASLSKYAGKPLGVLVRTSAQLAEVLAGNPFPDALPNRTVAIFLAAKPSKNALDEVTGRNGEQLALGKREIYVSYGEGMGKSKLKIQAAKSGTARNINTVAKLVDIAAK
jgi:uncharacterized protein (DUF1697 family)